MTIDIEKIKKLREETGAGVMDAKKALEETGGDYAKSVKILMEKGLAKAEKRADRAAGQGLVFCYIHSGAKVGSLLTEEFQKLGKEIAMQVATEEYASTDDLLDAEYVRDAGMKVKDLLAETVAKLGEKIEIRAFTRYSI
ncbi:MAG: Elongation factor Ts [candidate division WWE3 bacterium GW2011_GWC2_44_9]|uniref:Elongation factor Ts n=1 Tax=candidate division WWE3 bacterium GW2011_GWC2_44_9 TaxID=1619125 RepID=A0A0G1KMV5_UNCKA|nr:MAG: Elongation factor Ts [candidate division WWE3 bacterium GW2011_GWC2_44_9]